MNVSEARVAILDLVADVLVELGDDGEIDSGELREAMEDAAEMVLDALDLEVTSVNDDGSLTVRVRVDTDED